MSEQGAVDAITARMNEVWSDSFGATKPNIMLVSQGAVDAIQDAGFSSLEEFMAAVDGSEQ